MRKLQEVVDAVCTWALITLANKLEILLKPRIITIPCDCDALNH